MASLAALAGAAETAVDTALVKARAGIKEDVSDMRGVACMESVERTRFAPRRPTQNASCGDWIAAANSAPRGATVWRSRLRLDVTAGDAAEQFALTDASRFERGDVGGLLHAADAGSGEFSTFLRNLIDADTGQFQPGGLQQTPIGRLLAFGFTLPPVAATSSAAGRPGYRGSFYVVAESGELRRLAMEVQNPPDACRVRYSTEYNTTRLGDREIILPQSSTAEVLYRDGTELLTEKYYSGCRRPVAAPKPATDTASADPKPLPPGVRLRVRFEPPITSQTAATGDPVTGIIRTTVKDKQGGGVIVHAGDRVHGRIALIEEYLSPTPRWDLAIALETIERGVGDHGIDQGVEQAVSLVPLDDGDRNPHDDVTSQQEIEKMRPPGGGYFIFHGPSVVVDQKYETEWETR